MKDKILKFLSCLICVSVMLNLVAAVSFAESETIRDVSVHIYAPTDGDEITFYAFANGNGYDINDDFTYDNFIEGMRVYDLTDKKYYSEDDLVVAEHQYKVEVLITPEKGYKFEDYNGKPDVNAVFNSQEITLNYRNADVKWFADQKNIIMSYVYVVNKREVIGELNISVTAPADGEYPDFYSDVYEDNVNLNYNFDDDEYVINGVQWYAIPDDKTYSLVPMQKDEAFEGGMKYRVVLNVVAVQDYARGIERVFDADRYNYEKNYNVLINGGSTYTRNYQYSPEDKRNYMSCLSIFRDFYCPYRNRVEKVSLEIDPPMVGEKPDFSALMGISEYKVAENPDDAGFINGVKWHNNKTGENLTEEDCFMPGVAYSFVTYLVPKDDKTIFTKDSSGNTTVTGTLNGYEADISNAEIIDRNASLAIAFEYRFEPLSNVLSRMAVLDIELPLAGETPDYDATVVNEKFYYQDKSEDDGNTVINGIKWWDSTEEKFLECTDTFCVGHNYDVYVDLIIADDYVVDNTTSFAINDSEVMSALRVAGTNNIRLTYDFGTVKPYQTEYNRATDIEIPEEGAYPDFSVKLENDECYVESVKWYDVSAMAPVSITDKDKFVGGHSYQVELNLVPAENYEFSTDSNGNLTFGFGFEFNEEIFDETVSGDKNSVKATFEFDAIPINNIDISIDEPLPGHAPGFIAYPSNSACNASPISWYDKTEGVYIDEDSDYEFIENHVYVATVDVFTVGKASFNYLAPDFGASINGIPANVGTVVYSREGSETLIMYSRLVALRLSYEFEPCVTENVLAVDFDRYIGSVSASFQINSGFVDGDVAVYFAFYNSDNELVSCVSKNVEWANDIYSETAPDKSVRCKVMLWRKSIQKPLCDFEVCETVREEFDM